MTEKVMDINAIYSYLGMTLNSKKARVRESDRIITIIPIDEATTEKNFSCPLLGIADGSNLTVEKFLAMSREDKELEAW
ncbi:MAG: hypothetical protein FWH10_04945 [Oscillospiraceae bacterium]|nr:hypothetical protein [Oscillospiraceae bacterium]